MNIYVGNLPYEVTDEDLKSLFDDFGEIHNAKVIMDRETGRSRGFGFVEMPEQEDGEAAIQALNELDFQGRKLKVNEARPRSEQRPRGPYRRYTQHR